MFQCIECYLTKTGPGIRFQQPSLIKSLYFLLTLTNLFSYLDQVLYIGVAQKHILKTLTANFMNNVHVRNVCCSYKASE